MSEEWRCFKPIEKYGFFWCFFYSQWVGKTDVKVGSGHPCKCKESGLPTSIKENHLQALRKIKQLLYKANAQRPLHTVLIICGFFSDSSAICTISTDIFLLSHYNESKWRWMKCFIFKCVSQKTYILFCCLNFGA